MNVLAKNGQSCFLFSALALFNVTVFHISRTLPKLSLEASKLHWNFNDISLKRILTFWALIK